MEKNSIIKAYKIYGIIILSFLVIISTPMKIEASPELEYVHYKVGSGGSKINNLKLQANYSIDPVNNMDLEFLYNGDDINLEAAWALNFLNQKDSKLNLKLVLAKGLNNDSFGKGIGISGTYNGKNVYFMDTKYFLEDDNKFVFEGGIALPLVTSSKLSLSLGNSYWHPSDYILNLGILVNM